MDAKYLGVTLSNNLEWSKHIANEAISKVGIQDTLVFLICLMCWDGRVFLKEDRRLNLFCFTKLLTV